MECAVTAKANSNSEVCAAVQLLSGDEALAWAAIDAGVTYASAYPGTPATDIQESMSQFSQGSVRCVWSINEKVAYESALAVAIAGQRALVSMKHVGVNVAADAFINSCVAGVNGGLVLAIGDDAECHSSQNKQDSRHYRPLCSTLLLEPADSQECYSMTRDAFRLSEQTKMPVMLRLSTRTAYGCMPVRREAPEVKRKELNWPKDPQRFFIVPSNSRKHFVRIHQLQQELERLISVLPYTRRRQCSSASKRRLGIVCTGVGGLLANEYADNESGILKTAGEPFPEAELKQFVNDHARIVVLEEGDPILEVKVRALAATKVQVFGRLSGNLKSVGELDPVEVSALLRDQPPPLRPRLDAGMPQRLPEICKPCGYNKVFAALKQVPNLATPSDIGCNALGGLPPYSVMDGIWAMGSSIGVACGLAAVGHPRVLAIIGDSTFFHAGIPPLIEAIHENHKLTVLLLDNGTTAMTGGQGVAHRTAALQRKVDMVALIQSLGVTACVPFDPHKLGVEGIRDLVDHSFEQPGVKVLLYRSQCGIYSPGYYTESPWSLVKGGVTDVA